jgi:putative membrane protein
LKIPRYPRSVYSYGLEPDPRLTLANERTFLAWIRTSLALIALGIALNALQLPVRRGFHLYPSGIFILLGLLAPLHAWISWMRIERAMRINQPLPAPTFSGLVAIGVAIAGLLIAAGIFL